MFDYRRSDAARQPQQPNFPPAIVPTAPQKPIAVPHSPATPHSAPLDPPNQTRNGRSGHASPLFPLDGGGYFVPNFYVDRLMAFLTPEEFLVFSYAVRRTLGFNKLHDAISLSQFTHGTTARDGRQLDFGTGLSRPTILKAIGYLEYFGLLIRVGSHRRTTVFRIATDPRQIDLDALREMARKRDRKPAERPAVAISETLISDDFTDEAGADAGNNRGDADADVLEFTDPPSRLPIAVNPVDSAMATGLPHNNTEKKIRKKQTPPPPNFSTTHTEPRSFPPASLPALPSCAPTATPMADTMFAALADVHADRQPIRPTPEQRYELEVQLSRLNGPLDSATAVDFARWLRDGTDFDGWKRAAVSPAALIRRFEQIWGDYQQDARWHRRQPGDEAAKNWDQWAETARAENERFREEHRRRAETGAMSGREALYRAMAQALNLAPTPAASISETVADVPPPVPSAVATTDSVAVGFVAVDVDGAAGESVCGEPLAPESRFEPASVSASAPVESKPKPKPKPKRPAVPSPSEMHESRLPVPMGARNKLVAPSASVVAAPLPAVPIAGRSWGQSRRRPSTAADSISSDECSHFAADPRPPPRGRRCRCRCESWRRRNEN